MIYIYTLCIPYIYPIKIPAIEMCYHIDFHDIDPIQGPMIEDANMQSYSEWAPIWGAHIDPHEAPCDEEPWMNRWCRPHRNIYTLPLIYLYNKSILYNHTYIQVYYLINHNIYTIQDDMDIWTYIYTAYTGQHNIYIYIRYIYIFVSYMVIYNQTLYRGYIYIYIYNPIYIYIYDQDTGIQPDLLDRQLLRYINNPISKYRLVIYTKLILLGVGKLPLVGGHNLVELKEYTASGLSSEQKQKPTSRNTWDFFQSNIQRGSRKLIQLHNASPHTSASHTIHPLIHIHTTRST